MRYAVAIKQVPDTSEVTVNEEGNLVRTGVPSILDPYCEYALRKIAAMKKEGDEITVFTMGPPQASEALRRCLCLGADKAFLLSDPGFAGADVWATSRTLAAFIQKYACDSDLFVFGARSADGETGQVPFETAQLLSAQQFAYVADLTLEGDSFVCTQNYGGSLRECRVPKGSVVSFGGVDPCGTLMSISDRISGQRKTIETLGRVDLGLGLYSVGLKGSRTKIVSTDSSVIRRKNRKAVISSPERAAELIMGEMGVKR
ncbi:MAG: electron transfer flavoprotein subunit beta/FixA family protein [Candidatus Methanomethylophilaceae archaeon]|nr:electron transfer flavoprotein subunit beta/FixA family protein [Candidatus Methanomethylophilaceae archaeon]